MTTGSVLLWSLGTVAVLLLLCLIDIWFEKKFPGESYDERQRQVRGNAWGLASTIGVAYFLILYACLELKIELPLEVSTLIFIGLDIQLIVFHIYCLLNNAALPLGHNGWLTAGGYAFSGILYFINFRSRQKYLEWHTLYGEDSLGVTWAEATEDTYLMLLVCITFIALAAMHLIRLLWKEKE